LLGGGLDLDSGLHITIGDQTHVVNFTGAETVEDLLNRLNGSPAPLHARINAAGTGIDIRSRVSGADFRIGENGGATATQLGVRSYSRDTSLAELNYGRGVSTADGTDFTLRRSDGQELEIDLSSARTVGDVLDLINNHPDNQDPATAVTARLPAVGNGIELVDAGAIVTEPLTIIQATLSDAAFDLGFLASSETEAVADAGTNTLIGRDVNSKEAAGAFNSFLRLNEAVLAGDVIAIGRAVELIDQDLERVTFARGELGSRQQSLDFLEHRLQDENVELRRTLSEEIEADLVETISNLTARQTSLEASLKQAAATLQTTLLDFL
jgi:flagellar hook-associated protein 3 FlgL